METLYLVKGDNGSQIKVSVTRENTGLPVNLLDATVRLKVRKKGTQSLAFTIIAESLSDFEAGEAIFAFSSSNLSAQPGQYTGEVEATFTDGNIETIYEELSFVIREGY